MAKHFADADKAADNARNELANYVFSPEAMEFILSLVKEAFDDGFIEGATTAVVDHWDEEDILLCTAEHNDDDE